MFAFTTFEIIVPARVVAHTLLMLAAEWTGGKWADISSASGAFSGAKEAVTPASTVPILTVPALVITTPPSTGQQLYLAPSSSSLLKEGSVLSSSNVLVMQTKRASMSSGSIIAQTLIFNAHLFKKKSFTKYTP